MHDIPPFQTISDLGNRSRLLGTAISDTGHKGTALDDIEDPDEKKTSFLVSRKAGQLVSNHFPTGEFQASSLTISKASTCALAAGTEDIANCQP